MSGNVGSDHEESSDSDSDSPDEYVSSCDSSEEEEVELLDLPYVSPWAHSLGDEEVKARVEFLSALNCYSKACLGAKEDLVERFVFSMNEMSKEAGKTAFLTALATSAYADLGGRHRGEGERSRYVYIMPFCGVICKRAFQNAFNVSNQTLTRARAQVAEGRAFAQPHKNSANQHNVVVDRDLMIKWLREIAASIGEPHPVRFRRQRSVNGVTVRYTTRQDVTFLPAFLTWRDLHNQYCTLIADQHPETPKPSFAAFYKLLSKSCKDIQIASPRSNVCDICAIYRSHASRSPSTVETENQAVHAMDARAMRQQYAKDSGLVGSKTFVSTMDFAQNIAMPHAASMPSAWYFMSLIGVSVFGVYSENTSDQVNYIYSEQVAGKGSNEVVSMLHEYAIRTKIYGSGPGTASWTIYADNCGGQNKNSHLVRYLRFLVDSKRLRNASLNFLIKGHTKNNCDRGFGHIKRAYAKRDLYTIEQVNEVVESSSTSNSSVCLEDVDGVFFDWKSSLQPVYRDLTTIQSYQLFSFPSYTDGLVLCRKRPTSTNVHQQILKSSAIDLEEVWKSLQPLPKCGANPEKVTDLHKKILPYIPEEYRSCSLYRAPTEEERAETLQKKRRRKKTPTWLERQAANHAAEETPQPPMS